MRPRKGVKMTTETPITVTSLAAEKILEVFKSEGKDPATSSLRVFVQGGGCSGFQYGIMLNEDLTASDIEFQSNGIKVVVDPISIRYLQGAEIDFTDNPAGGDFTITNPNAKSTCGCGSSFNTE